MGVLSFSGVTLALGRGLRVDRCQRTSLTEGDAFAAGVGFRLWARWGMQQGGWMRDLKGCMGKVFG